MDLGYKAIFLALVLSQFAEGLFFFVTPFYLTSQGISLLDIGIIFSVAALAMVLMRILLGAYTDIRGRKLVFASSFLIQVVSSSFFPFVRNILDTTPVKIMYDLGISVRGSLKSTIFFESAQKIYRKIIAWIDGAEHLMLASVSFAAAFILSILGYAGSYFLIALFQFIPFLIVMAAYKEKSNTSTSSRVSIKDMYNLDLRRNMWVIMFATMLGLAGVRLSHGFAEPLYFQAKYKLDATQIGLIIGLHRLSLALPLLFVGTIMHKLDVKKAFILSTVVMSLFLLAMGLVENIFMALPLWLLHDVFGGSVFLPSIHVLTQLNARDGKRGKDVNTMDLLSGLVGIVTPSLTGALITVQWDLMFLVGGSLSFFGALIVYLFYR